MEGLSIKTINEKAANITVRKYKSIQVYFSLAEMYNNTNTNTNFECVLTFAGVSWFGGSRNTQIRSNSRKPYCMLALWRMQNVIICTKMSDFAKFVLLLKTQKTWPWVNVSNLKTQIILRNVERSVLVISITRSLRSWKCGQSLEVICLIKVIAKLWKWLSWVKFTFCEKCVVCCVILGA